MLPLEICSSSSGQGNRSTYLSCAFTFFKTQPLTSTKGNPMSTDYGYATVQFPGFPAIRFSTVNQYMICPGTERPWGYVPHSYLPRKKVVAENGRVVHLSRKERSRLRTLVKKWNRRGRRNGRGYGSLAAAYRTLDEVTSY